MTYCEKCAGARGTLRRRSIVLTRKKQNVRNWNGETHEEITAYCCDHLYYVLSS